MQSQLVPPQEEFSALRLQVRGERADHSSSFYILIVLLAA